MASNRQRAAEKALHDQTNILPFAQLMVVFSGLAISLLITMSDQNGISVTLPTIARDLNAQDTISWAGTSSLIANTMFTVLYGRLSDIFGRKNIYISALGLLCIADLCCGLSVNSTMFYVFRGLAGVAGGGVTSLTMIIVSDIVTLEQRGKYQGILGAALGTGNVIGPFIAAAFIMDSTWRGFFWLISPLAAVSAIVGFFLIPNNAKKGNFWQNVKRIDWWGVLASSIAIIFILIPISGGGSYFQWDSAMVISMLVIGGLSFVAFILIEWKVASLPMLPMAFFKNQVITALLVQSFLLGAVYQAYLYYLPLYYQNARGWDPIVSAALTAPMVACQSVSSVCSGQYISRLKRYAEVIWFGFGLWTLGAGLMLLFGRHTHPGVIAVIVGITGLGIGCTFQPTMVAIQAHATKSQRAVVISNRNFFRCMGGSVGLAVSAALLQATLKSSLPSNLAYLAKSSYSLPSESSVSASEWSEILSSYTKASHSVFILQVPLIGVCFLACLLIRDRGLERPKEPEEIEEEKRKAEQAARDAEAALHEVDENENHEIEETTEKRHSMSSTLAESSMPPSRAEPELANLEEKKTLEQRECIHLDRALDRLGRQVRRRGTTIRGSVGERHVPACDNEYPTCSNCQKAGVPCDKSSVREDADRQNNYTRALEERVAFLEGKLGHADTATANQNATSTNAVASLWSPQGGNATPQTTTPGLDNNPVGDIVGLLALSSSEAPAYVGASSGLSLAANLGEMVQTSVWNQFMSRMHQKQNSSSANASQTPIDSGADQFQHQKQSGATGGCARARDRSMNIDPPNDEVGSKILDTYFTRLHARYPFLDRSKTWRLHEDRWRLAKTKHDDLTQDDRYTIFKLNMIYAIGTTMLKISEDKKFTNAQPERFYANALQYAPTMCDARSIENIEAMVLLVVYHLRTASSHGMWYMIGLAMRTAIDLGLHRKANEINMDPFSAQMRRRLFWTVYYLERVVSMSLGRPFSISDRHIDLDLPWDVDDDVEDPAILTAPQDLTKTSNLTFSIYLFKLRRIDSRIQHKIYRADRPLSSLRPKMDPLYLELEQWKESAFLRFTGPDLDYPMLHYNRAVRLLIQPFLPLLPITDPFYHICLRAAGEICQSHKRLHQTLEYGHSFLAVQTVFMAGITLLYAVWTHTEQVWSVRMSNDIRACSTVLFVMGERAAWVKKYRDAFELLVNAAMEKLQGNETARNTGMTELMTAKHGGICSSNNNTSDMPIGEKFPPANPTGLAPEATGSTYPADDTDHAVRMALQLAPWIDQDESDPLWMPDFETLENLSGTFWSHADTTLFDAL
ncbi:C6 transcription factor [Penicillium herquei]|nr:C6 transcription factor [Penicillium herquei]